LTIEERLQACGDGFKQPEPGQIVREIDFKSSGHADLRIQQEASVTRAADLLHRLVPVSTFFADCGWAWTGPLTTS